MLNFKLFSSKNQKKNQKMGGPKNKNTHFFSQSYDFE